MHEASESRPIPEWELKYKADIKPSFLQHYTRVHRKEIKECWMLDLGQIGSSDDSREDCGWDSSDDSGINVEEDSVYSNDLYCDPSDDSDINVEEDSVYSNHLYFDIRSSMDFLHYPRQFFPDGLNRHGKCPKPSEKAIPDGYRQGSAVRKQFTESHPSLTENRHGMVPDGCTRQGKLSASVSSSPSGILFPSVLNRQETFELSPSAMNRRGMSLSSLTATNRQGILKLALTI
jgi:hypothetical protein